MSSYGSLALAAAQRVERSVGAGRVALRAYQALLEGNDKAVVLEAALGALRSALRIDDGDAIAALASFWATLTELDAFARIAPMVVALHDEGRDAVAERLAAAEVARRPSSSAHYLRARISREPLRRDCFRAAVSLGEEPAASQARCALIAETSHAHEALALAADVDALSLSPIQRLLVATALLSSPRRFVRARALSSLCDLAGDPTVDARFRRRAVVAAGKHADRRDASELERERIAAALATWPDAEARALAEARLMCAADPRRDHKGDAYTLLASAVVEGHDVAIDPDASDGHRGLAVLAAMHGGDRSGARALLDGAPGGWQHAALWTAALFALHDEPTLVAAAIRALARAGPSRPPRGYSPYVAALDEDSALGVTLSTRAALANEPLAAAALARTEVRSAWALVDSDPGAALLRLRRAKALATAAPGG